MNDTHLQPFLNRNARITYANGETHIGWLSLNHDHVWMLNDIAVDLSRVKAIDAPDDDTFVLTEALDPM